MSLGARIKEERVRLGFNQTKFAELAGASRRAMVNWESDGAAPLVTALIAWADAGADALYILTGDRTPSGDVSVATSIEPELAELGRDLLDPLRHRLIYDSDEHAERATLENARNRLLRMLEFDFSLMTPEQIATAEQLLENTYDEKKLAIFRAQDFIRNRKLREEFRADIAEYLNGAPYSPGSSVLNLLTTLSLEFSVPVKFVAEVVWEISCEITGTPTFSTGGEK